MPIYNIIPINNETFDKMETQWRQCLENSEANPLFSSWIWQNTWWKIWKPRLNLELLLLGIYQQDSLIGIIPCYTYTYTSRLGFKHKRCEYIGAYSANNDSIRSEYLNFILPSGLYHKFLPLIFNYFKQQHIDEIILKDIDANNDTTQWLKNNFPNANQSSDIGIKIQSEQGFTSYLSTLGKNTRLKLYNRRKNLQPHYTDNIKSKHEIPIFFEQLNKMHLERWGKICFSEHSLRFHSQIAEYFLNQQQLHAISLYENGQIQSVCYDITLNNVRYNLQLGFYPFSDKKISIGTLTLGFAIEQAFSEPQTKYYDLLAGSGKNTFYKKQFKGDKQSFISFRIPQTFQLKIMYMIKHKIFYFKQIIENYI